MAGSSPDQDAPARRACLELRADLKRNFKAKVVTRSSEFPEANGGKDKQYICWHDISPFWTTNNILGVLQGQALTGSELSYLKERLLKVLSILVYIKADDCLDNFRILFFDDHTRVELSDSDLPLATPDLLPQLNTNELKSKFLRHQYLFNPVRMHFSSIPF